jgi:hypothetical protein
MIRALGLSMVIACVPASQAEPEVPHPPANDLPFIVNPTGGDRVGPGDQVTADGQPDIELTATVQGVVSGIILSVCDEGGRPSVSHWDTYTGEAMLPAGFAWTAGKQTWVLGVSDGAGTLLNAGDGSFAAIELATPTPLTLSAANPGGVGSGTLLCIWVMRPDGTAARASTRIP